MTMVANVDSPNLFERWRMLLVAKPGLRIRNAADELGVSELELQLCRHDGFQPLRPDFGDLLSEMDAVGDVMILSRNDQVVHEVTATFDNFRVVGKGTMGLAVGDIDIRVFLNHWAYGYWVTEKARGITRESLQFFNRKGQALHKIYRTDATNADAWKTLVRQYLDTSGVKPKIEPGGDGAPRANALDIDVESLREAWGKLKDVHHFNAMLKRHRVDRLTAVELMVSDWARKLRNPAPEGVPPLELLLNQVAESRCPVMVFVGNAGIVQIFTGEVTNLRRTGPWMNVLDRGFSLHANTDDIVDWYTVRRPSADGTVTSVEGYNADGDIVITLFGKRKPGQPESEDWRTEVARLEEALCV